MTNVRRRVFEYVLVVSVLIVPELGCTTSHTVTFERAAENPSIDLYTLSAAPPATTRRSQHKEVADAAGQAGKASTPHATSPSAGVQQSQHKEVAENTGSGGSSSVSGQKFAASDAGNPTTESATRKPERQMPDSASSGARQSQHKEVAGAAGQAGRELPPTPHPSGVSPNSGVRQSQQHETAVSPNSGDRQSQQQETANSGASLTDDKAPPGKSNAQALEVKINSLPEGAEILLSGKVDGAFIPCKRGDRQLLTPARLDRLPSGEWWVKVRKAGYKESEPKMVRLESTTEVISLTFELVAARK